MPTETGVARIGGSSPDQENDSASLLPLVPVCNELVDQLEVRFVTALAPAVGQQGSEPDPMETSNSSLTKLGDRS